MTCTRCEKEISFTQWLEEICYVKGIIIHWFHHRASEEDIRQAYHQMELESSYSRNQP